MTDPAPSKRQFRDWAGRISQVVREMEATTMHDATPVLCAARAAQYVAFATLEAADAPAPEEGMGTERRWFNNG